MSEAMTVETIVEAYWRLKGYWAQLRFPFQTKGGGWADVDVLAYHPMQKNLVISESKVRGPKKDVYVYTQYTREKEGTIFDYDTAGYLSFLRHLEIICSNGIVFKNFKGTVDNLIIQLVSNYYVDDNVWPEVKRDILQEIGNSVPRGIKTEMRLDTTFGILSEIIKLEKSSTQGRRYGHPVLDIARELNRYLHPNIKSAGRKKAEIEAIKEKFRKIFMELLK